MPVTTGEQFTRLSQFLELLTPHVVDITQPELLSIRGISGALKAAAIAEASVALHKAQSPLGTALNTHIHAAILSFLIQECFDDFLVPWGREFVQGVPPVIDGPSVRREQLPEALRGRIGAAGEIVTDPHGR